MSEPRRSRKSVDALEKLERSHLLTSEGKAWLVQALDPFHDTEFAPADIPDFGRQAVVVQCIKGTQALIAPGGIQADQTWGCHISTLPVAHLINTDRVTTLNQSVRFQNEIQGEGVGTFTVSSQISSGPGTIYFPQGTAFPVTPTFGVAPAGNIDTPSSQVGRPRFADGQSRIVGLAFEVVNTSPPLTAQGVVTCYRQPNTIDFRNYYYLPDPSSSTSVLTPYTQLLLPPPTSAAAMLLEGANQWEATEGAYAIACPTSTDLPFEIPQPDPILLRQPAPGALESGVPSAAYGKIITSSSDTMALYPVYGNWSNAGVIFEGLASTNTLQLNWRVFIARAPTWAEPDIAVLARPSAEFDPVALEIFGHSMRQLPPACRLSENPLGEWFRKVANTVGSVARTVAPAVSAIHPGIGAAVGTVGRLVTPERVDSVGSGVSKAQAAMKNVVSKVKRKRVAAGGRATG